MFEPTDINLRCGRVPSKLANGSSMWIPGFHQEVTELSDAEYVDDEMSIFLSRLSVAARKEEAVGSVFLDREREIGELTY